MEEIVTVAEVAKIRGVHKDTVRRWCAEGWLKSAKMMGRTWVMLKSEALAFEPPKPGPEPSSDLRRVFDQLKEVLNLEREFETRWEWDIKDSLIDSAWPQYWDYNRELLEAGGVDEDQAFKNWLDEAHQEELAKFLAAMYQRMVDMLLGKGTAGARWAEFLKSERYDEIMSKGTGKQPE